MMRVLLVEDSDPLRQLFARLLKGNGFEVREAANGREALDCLPNFVPDIVVTDLMMPVVDGFELIRQLRAMPTTAVVPVVVMTAGEANDTESEVRRAGAAEFLAKPFDFRTLLDRVGGFRALERFDSLGCAQASEIHPPDPPFARGGVRGSRWPAAASRSCKGRAGGSASWLSRVRPARSFTKPQSLSRLIGQLPLRILERCLEKISPRSSIPGFRTRSWPFFTTAMKPSHISSLTPDPTSPASGAGSGCGNAPSCRSGRRP